MSDSKDHPHSHDHDHGDHEHEHAAPNPKSDVLPDDAGTEALSAALRSSFAIVKVFMAILVVVFLFSGVFKVEPQQRAVVFRFGKPQGPIEKQLLGPGLHWSWPAPIDEVQKISIGEIQTVRSTIGWYLTTPDLEARGEEPAPRPSMVPILDGYTLTADGNIIHSRATIRYRITDPITYIFSFVNSSNMVLNALNNAIVRASAQFTVDQVLRLDVAGFKERIVNILNESITSQKLGISLELADVIVAPPLFVKPSFNDVLAAEQERDKRISEARGYSISLTSLTQGEATNIVSKGQSDRVGLLLSLKGEVSAFTNYLAVYERNPGLYRQILLTEAWQRVLTNAYEKKILPDLVDGAQREVRLLLGREPLKPSTGTTNQVR